MANCTVGVDTLINTLQNFEDKHDQDINDFLSQFDNLASAANFTDQIKLALIKAKIAGRAKEIVLNTPDFYEAKDYQTIKQRLKDYFQREKSLAQAQQNFINAKQKPNQSVNDFTKLFSIDAQKYLAVSGHASKEGAKDFLETIKLTKYTEALRPDIGFEILKAAPKTFQEAVTLAKNIEVALNSKASSEINNTEIKTDNTVYEALMNLTKEQNDQITQLKEQINALKINENNRTQTQNKTDQLPAFCHICKKSNHETDNCFYNKKTNSANNFRNQSMQRPRFPSHPWNKHNRYQYFRETPRQIIPAFYTPIQPLQQNQNTAIPYWGTNPESIATQQQNLNNGAVAQNFSSPQAQFQQMPYRQITQNTMQQNYSQGNLQTPTITFPQDNPNHRNYNNRNRKNRSNLN